MDIELIEIRDFLSGHHPFDLLPTDALATLPEKIKSTYSRAETIVLEPGKSCEYLYIIRTGSVETSSPDGQLLARLGEGECFGVHAMLNEDSLARNQAMAMEDSLFYLLPRAEFERLRADYQQFAYFFAPLGADRLRDAHSHGSGESSDEQLNLMSFKTEDLLTRGPVTIEEGATIREAAQVMSENRVSCILITKGPELKGIMTDRDLRNRVVAQGVSFDNPVTDIMTAEPITLDADTYAFDALMTMTRKNIRHLPITRGADVAGVITNSNLIQKQTKSVVYLVGDIYKQTTTEGLADIIKNTPEVLSNLVETGATAHNIGHIVTSLSEAATIRLLQMAEEKLGPPPIPYVWYAAGSQARHEQTGVSDQDNFIVMDDSYEETKHGEYFEELAKFVNAGLNEVGYVYCPGEMMAQTVKWRQPLSVWKSYFTKWIEEPDPKSLMLSCIFFDLRPIRGEMALHEELKKLVMEKGASNQLYLGYMVANALTHSPPIGFFKNFVLIKGGDNDHRFDLKHNGVVPIVDIARIHALDAGIEDVNTTDRLNGDQRSKMLSAVGAQDLLDAYEFIAITRLKHQSAQIKAGEKPSNFMAPDNLSHFERNHLKDAFSVVKTIQSAMANAHPV